MAGHLIPFDPMVFLYMQVHVSLAVSRAQRGLPATRSKTLSAGAVKLGVSWGQVELYVIC